MPAQRRNRKNGRFSSSRRRRSKPKVNLIDTATSIVVANAITQGLGNANLKDFLMGTKDGKYVAGSDGSGRLTLPELVTGVNIGSGYAGGTLGGVLSII